MDFSKMLHYTFRGQTTFHVIIKSIFYYNAMHREYWFVASDHYYLLYQYFIGFFYTYDDFLIYVF